MRECWGRGRIKVVMEKILKKIPDRLGTFLENFFVILWFFLLTPKCILEYHPTLRFRGVMPKGSLRP